MQEKVTNKKHFDSERNISAREKVEVANMIAIQYDGAKGLFKERLNKLFADQKCTVVAFSEKAGITRQAMTSYLNGENVPDMKRLFQICQAFHVSADYLLGLSETKSPDPDAQAACKYIGLSEENTKRLKEIGSDNAPINIVGIETIISDPNFYPLVHYLGLAVEYAANYVHDYKSLADSLKYANGHVSLDDETKEAIRESVEMLDNIDLCNYRTVQALNNIIGFYRGRLTEMENTFFSAIDTLFETPNSEKDGANNGQY